MRRAPARPRGRAAALIASVCARATRPNCGMKTTVTRMMMLIRPGPSTATSASARIRLGNELTMSKTARIARSTGDRRIGRGDAEQDADAPAPSPSPRAPRRRRCACRRGRANRGRGRDGRCPASGWPRAASAAPATSIWLGRCVAISGASEPAEHDDAASRSARAGRSGFARCGAEHAEHQAPPPARARPSVSRMRGSSQA